MERLLAFTIAGFAAQLVDGSLGMGYGMTSTSFLVAAGTAPALASASVHVAELGTSLVSGIAHHRFGNVDWRAVRWLAFPGAVGGFLGATVLSNLPTGAAKPWMAVILGALGIYVLLRFRFGRGIDTAAAVHPHRGRFFAGLGLGAGFIDATGGGGWGPVSTPTLLAAGRMEPRKVIGTVSTSEFLVALGASIGFLLSLPGSRLDAGFIGALLAGGLVAGPLAAWVVRHLNPRTLGTAVGGFIVVTNIRTLGSALGVSDGVLVPTTMVIAVVWSVALAVSAIRRRTAPSVPTLAQAA